ncbi:biotin--[acetyl-CoA-carboxylase] ligase [Dialister hominis]|jgi:BirA family biotin operon repressor/biotin-[acetyl-CoA-carboxylase] ligase|uniref:Bifunctional ligase/repressor BirA n=1 Tax=Dialister hominis TaxID=2582419 RepID=A0A8D4UTX0_9FIRM|nr:biotin--[acetyl-CoA-carboxylase] ligase [Dialister hominis]MEE1349387.1 biotin--[acetyl-CoA-carboxylase] ligase [Dialister hominis]UYJ16617.1 MAG: biotin--[acetyl-CoA-carboxylase] ligase [Veillonellaceae bacterium]BBK24720.1 bifunctional ligase/repressor BirA [Dialister hominis]CDD78640.1 biotin-[acetyl-CoA-carboxylase] ligase [Dialister sp. CAG:357]
MRNEILDYFRKADGNFVSGQQISKDLHVSRTAIWKHINVLKERGYIFESSTRKGYRLIYAPNLLTPLEIDSALHTETFGRHVVYLESTQSTNEEAKKIAREGAEEGTIVVAEEQITGHGRLARGFYSPFAKGIWFSLILRPKFFPMEASKCTLLAAVGVCRGIRRMGLADAGIKWPNDILVHGKKLVGILTLMSASMEKIDYIIMGIGINTGIKKNEFPEDFREGATSFLNEGINVSRKDLLAAILGELEKEYSIAQDEGFDKVLDDWRALSVTLGQEVRVIFGDDSYTGKAVDIDRDGCLLVNTGSEVKRVIAGDVSIRPVDAPIPKR